MGKYSMDIWTFSLVIVSRHHNIKKDYLPMYNSQVVLEGRVPLRYWYFPAPWV